MEVKREARSTGPPFATVPKSLDQRGSAEGEFGVNVMSI
jgi:hypothetical protein